VALRDVGLRGLYPGALAPDEKQPHLRRALELRPVHLPVGIHAPGSGYCRGRQRPRRARTAARMGLVGIPNAETVALAKGPAAWLSRPACRRISVALTSGPRDGQLATPRARGLASARRGPCINCCFCDEDLEGFFLPCAARATALRSSRIGCRCVRRCRAA